MSLRNSISNEKGNAVISVAQADYNSEENVNTAPFGEVVKISEYVDEAMQIAVENADQHLEIDEKAFKKIRRKIDFYILPVICILYSLQFMDKLTNSYAAILGLRTDLKMKGDMYAWTGSAFYLGYLVFELPSVYLLQRFPVAKTVLVFIILWGIILCLHSVPQYAGFITLRTILGMLESAVTPAFVIITAQWYRKEEVFFRTGLWFSFNGVGTILGSGAIAYTVYNDALSFSLPAWKLVFIITGVLTIALGTLIFFHIPDTPSQAWFLTDVEKRLVVERIRDNQQGFGNRHFKKEQFKEALLDPQTWIYFFFALIGNIPNGGMTNFTSILLNEKFGFSTKKTLLIGMINGAIEVVGCSFIAYCYRFIQIRHFWTILSLSLMLLGGCLLAFGKEKSVQFAGLCLYALGPAGFICVLSSIASNVTGHTKKVTVNGIMLVGYCVGNLIGPQTFVAKEAPKYQSAIVTIVACSCVSISLLASLWVLYALRNKKRDKLGVVGDFNLQNHEFADLTDKQNPFFHYTL